MTDDLYPPSVQGVPPELTKPNAQYRRQVVIVLICLVIFIVFYFGLIAGSAWIVWLAIQQASSAGDDGTRHTSDNGLGIAAILAAVLFLFLVKALFKWHRQKDETRLEITEQEHPQLFAFVHRICDDTKAPFPKRVFVTPEVNAAVFYNSSLLSLILPVKKNLMIGLGLVNGLNLSEFKAVLAHEFGHFSQSSMRLGSYVYTANRVIYDLVYHRDVFDDLLAKARRTNIRIAIFAYLATFVLWLLRQVLQIAFRLINLFESALSRQMEFHADLVAVSVTGSDALIHALKKLEFTNACLMQAMHDLKAASEHTLVTSDLFYHQTRAADHLRRDADKQDLGMVPELPADPMHKVELFTKEEDSGDSDGMWASHPSHYDREQNAKRHYIRSPEDMRSPWMLFSNPEQLRQKMTRLFYQHILELPMSPPEVAPEQVEAFIEQEHEETRQDPKYGGLYDGRLLSIEPELLTQYANDPALPSLQPDVMIGVIECQYRTETKAWMEAHHRRREEKAILTAIEEGETKLKNGSFEFRGQSHSKLEAKSLLSMVEQELAADDQWLKQFDRDVFQTHLRMAQLLGEGDRDLYERYYFHLHLQATLVAARQEEFRLISLFQYAASKQEALSKNDFAAMITQLNEAHAHLLSTLRDHGSVPMPLLQNVTPGIALASFLLDQPLVAAMPSDAKRIEGDWAAALGRQASQMEERARRLYFKSMGAILARQEAIAAAWQTSQTAMTTENRNAVLSI